nr:hypothetical protein [Hungatella hathewayi]
MRYDETVITQTLSHLGEKAKRLSTHPAEMPPENFGNFTMDFFNWFGLLWAAQYPVQLTPGNCLDLGTFLWPAVPALCNAQPFIKENISSWFMEQDFDPVTSFPTEEEQG